MLERYLLIWLTLVSLAAGLWPSTTLASHDPFAASQAWLGYLFAVTMFMIGGMLPRDEIRHVRARWPAVISGTCVQYTAMPIGAWAFGRLFGYEGDLLIGIILVGAVPGAMASNILTLTARGNVSYSVSLTTASTLLSPLVVPAILFLAIGESDIDKWALAGKSFRLLIAQVVGPVLCGYGLAQVSERAAHGMKKIGPTIANLTILWIIAVVVNKHHGAFLKIAPGLVLVLLAVNIAGYLAGYAAAKWFRLPDAMRRALALEVGLQNAGLGAVLAGQLFPNRPEVALPPALYTFGCMLTGTILAQWWARRPAEEAVESEQTEIET
jgi:BASS family bile acid:Na+ symporter